MSRIKVKIMWLTLQTQLVSVMPDRELRIIAMLNILTARVNVEKRKLGSLTVVFGFL